MGVLLVLLWLVRWLMANQLDESCVKSRLFSLAGNIWLDRLLLALTKEFDAFQPAKDIYISSSLQSWVADGVALLIVKI